MLGSGVLSAGCGLLLVSWERVLPPEPWDHVCVSLPSCVFFFTFVYHCRVVAFPSMKTALGEDKANMLGPCLLDTCRSGCSSESQLPFVQWLLFEEYSLRLCPVLGFLRVGIDFPPADA